MDTILLDCVYVNFIFSSKNFVANNSAAKYEF